MFNYFGGKRECAHKYPQPRYPLIIEPFAGAAAYSCLYHQHQVMLNDLSPAVSGIWEWIITATEADIDALPCVLEGDHLDKFNLTLPVRNLLGFQCNRGSAHRANTYQGYAAAGNDIPRLYERLRRFEHRHWKISNLDYQSLPNIEATWFVDAPYEKQGTVYKFGKDINYKDLGEWCRSRQGQVIVCESEFATWLPFRAWHTHKAFKPEVEYIWSNLPL